MTVTSADRGPGSTLQDVRDASANRRGRRIRHATVALMTLVVALGGAGALGGRTTTDRSSAGGWTVEIRHARVSRAGLDTPWEVTVRHPGGFDGPITLATTASWFDLFETQGFAPEPSAETSTPRTLYQQFDPPPGDTFTVRYDAYVQPAAQRGRSAVTVVLVGGREVGRVAYRMRLLP